LKPLTRVIEKTNQLFFRAQRLIQSKRALWDNSYSELNTSDT